MSTNDKRIALQVHSSTSSFDAYIRVMVHEQGYNRGYATHLYNDIEQARREQAAQSVTATDCRSAEGVTVGIIDSIITLCRLYKGREVTPAVHEALRDLATDEDFAKILSDIKESASV